MLIFLINEMTIRNILELYFLYFMSINLNKKYINVSIIQKAYIQLHNFNTSLDIYHARNYHEAFLKNFLIFTTHFYFGAHMNQQVRDGIVISLHLSLSSSSSVNFDISIFSETIGYGCSLNAPLQILCFFYQSEILYRKKDPDGAKKGSLFSFFYLFYCAVLHVLCFIS